MHAGSRRVLSWQDCCVSRQVYESLAKAEDFPAEKLAYFDVEGGEDLLHEMRFLPVAARPAAAEYIVDNGLDATVTEQDTLPAAPLRPCLCVVAVELLGVEKQELELS